MKNKEKYAKEIIEIASKGHAIALDKREMKLCACDELYCNNCYFHANDGSCNVNIRRWANEEAEFTHEEKVEKLEEYCAGKHIQECAFYDFADCCCDFDRFLEIDKELGTDVINKMYKMIEG